MSYEPFILGNHSGIGNLVQSECFLCDKNDVHWKDSVRSANVVDVSQQSDYDWLNVQNFWAGKNAVVACKNGHLFDRACINRHEAIYAMNHGNARFPCPLCKNKELVFDKKDRKIFVHQFSHSPNQTYSYTKLRVDPGSPNGGCVSTTSILAQNTTPNTTPGVYGTIEAAPPTHMYGTIEAAPPTHMYGNIEAARPTGTPAYIQGRRAEHSRQNTCSRYGQRQFIQQPHRPI